MTQLTKCPITKLPVLNLSSGDIISYDINIDDEIYSLRFCRTCFSNINFNTYGYILTGLLLNKRLNDRDIIHWDTNKKDEFDLKKFIEQEDYPKTPSQKLDFLFLSFYKLQTYEGTIFSVHNIKKSDFIFGRYYLKNTAEFNFFMDTIVEKGLLNREPNGTINITYEGLLYAIKISEDGQLSNKCFIAMSFDKEDYPIYEAIKSACESTGFEPKRIDTEHYESEITINDAMIALIKKCKFTIADFTKQKDGAYFEAGYSLGRGMKVIYTCQKDWFEKSHFDTNHFPHIIYDSPKDLTKKLIDKIEAWVKV